METTEEARRVIESIQRKRYLHPDDIAAREGDPDGLDTARHEDTIEELERMVELYAPDKTGAHTKYVEFPKTSTPTPTISFLSLFKMQMMLNITKTRALLLSFNCRELS